MGNWVWGDQQAACSRWRLWASVPRVDSSGPTVSLTLDTAGSGRGASCEEKALQAQVAPGVAGQGREGAERQAQQSGLLGRQRGTVGGLSREDSVVGGLQHRVGGAQVRLLGRAGLEVTGAQLGQQQGLEEAKRMNVGRPAWGQPLAPFTCATQVCPIPCILFFEHKVRLELGQHRAPLCLPPSAKLPGRGGREPVAPHPCSCSALLGRWGGDPGTCL